MKAYEIETKKILNIFFDLGTFLTVYCIHVEGQLPILLP